LRLATWFDPFCLSETHSCLPNESQQQEKDWD